MAIPSAGGPVRVGVVTMDFPAAGLNGNTETGVSSITPPGEVGLLAFRFVPDGATFTEDITVTISYAEATYAGLVPEYLAIATHNADRTWTWQQPQLDAAAKTLTFKTRELSEVMVFKTIQVERSEGWVVENLSLQLTVMQSVRDGSPLVVGWEPLSERVAGVGPWSVNGTEGGNEVMGKITTRKKPLAIYKAPTTVSGWLKVHAGTSLQGRLVPSAAIGTDFRAFPRRGDKSSMVCIGVSYDGWSMRYPAETRVHKAFKVSTPFPFPYADVSQFPVENLPAEMSVTDYPTEAMSVNDAREGCPQPVIHGRTEVLEVREIRPAGTTISVTGTGMSPKMTVGSGHSVCDGHTTELEAHTASTTFQATGTSDWWRKAALKGDSYRTPDGFTVSVSPNACG